MIVTAPVPCALCGRAGADVRWCGLCRVWLCDACRRRWDRRALGALRSLLGR
jgi:hypothetical protein